MNTRVLGLLCTSLLVVLGTACGDDGNNNNGTCGDGHTTGAETCDDGNTTSGDGCSSSCKIESGRCGDNTVDVATETCDDGNTASGDGCDATCHVEAPVGCGNGMIVAPETCDDGNTAANDGCSATCATETGYTCTGTPSVCTMGGGAGGTCTAPSTLTLTAMGTDLAGTGTGDTTSAMNNLPAGACDGGTAGGGNDNIWKFTLTDTRDVIVLLESTTAFDGGIRVMTSPCDITTEVIDVAGVDGCSDAGVVGDTEALGYVKLPPGTYYVSVDGYTDQDMGTYSFSVTAKLTECGNGNVGILEQCDDSNQAAGDGCNAKCEVETGYNCTQPMTGPSVCQMIGCGDGLLQAGETCDDDNIAPGDGCDATCHVETGYSCSAAEPSVCVMQGCGNGIIENAEECDDGNLASNDRCSSGCLLEQDVTEAEPNNTAAQAQALTAGNHIIRGTFSTGDTDLYTFTLATAQTVEIETYFTINGTTTDYGGVGSNPLFDCTTADDHVVAVYAAGADVTMDTTALALDSDDGDSYCSYLGPADSADNNIETGADPTQLLNLPAGTYTIRVTADAFTPTTTPRRYMLDLKIGGSAMVPVAPAAGDIKINEFLAADGPATGGTDSNCDGIFTGTDDEFIELVNVSNKTLDLTGLTIKDGGAPQATPPVPPQLAFTFAPAATGSMTLAPGKAVVVWAGGAPNCPGVTNWFTAPPTQHTLRLNDGGDTITLATGAANPVTVAQVIYPAQTVGTSSNLSPDVTGTTYALHTTLNATVKASPGKHANGTAF